MKRTLVAWAAGLLVVLTSCSQSDNAGPSTAKRPPSPYFDMLGFLNKLEANAKGHAFRKRSLLGDKFEEATSEHPDYHRELAIFYTADLTKPGWSGLFSTQKKGDMTSYVAQDERPELRLLVVNRDAQGIVQNVQVNLAQHNYLYDSDAWGTLFVRYENGEPLLDSVALSGSQKIILSSPFTYTLQGKTL